MAAWLLIAVLVAVEPEADTAYVSLDDAMAITTLIERLSAESFETREQAFFYLQCHRGRAVPFLKSARKGASFHLSRQIDYLLDHIPLKQKMIAVPGGRVQLGSEDELCRNPKRDVDLKPYSIDVFETTNFMYSVFVRSTQHPPPQSWKGGRYRIGAENHPVTGITYNDASAYAAWCGKRLPNADEWEFAARGNEGRLFPWGDQEFRGAANIDNLSTFHSEDVGSYEKDTSPVGCIDMAGNVSEWVILVLADGTRITASKGSAFNKTWRRPYTLCSYSAIPKKAGYHSRDTGFRCVR